MINAGYDAIDRWVRFGIGPQRPPQIQFDPATNVVMRDELGLALGGIRLSQLEVPTALNTGVNGGPVFCRLFGTHQPFDQATLDDLYPSHVGYVADVGRVTANNLRHASSASPTRSAPSTKPSAPTSAARAPAAPSPASPRRRGSVRRPG